MGKRGCAHGIRQTIPNAGSSISNWVTSSRQVPELLSASCGYIFKRKVSLSLFPGVSKMLPPTDPFQGQVFMHVYPSVPRLPRGYMTLDGPKGITVQILYFHSYPAWQQLDKRKLPLTIPNALWSLLPGYGLPKRKALWTTTPLS